MDIIISSATCTVAFYYMKKWEYKLYLTKQPKTTSSQKPAVSVSASSIIYNISTILLVNTLAEEFLRIVAVAGGINNTVSIVIAVVIVRSWSHIMLTLY